MQRRQRQRRTATSSSLVSLNAFLYVFFSSLCLFHFYFKIWISRRRSDSQVVFKLIAFCGMSAVPAKSSLLSLSLPIISHSFPMSAAAPVAAAATEAVKEFLHPTAKRGCCCCRWWWLWAEERASSQRTHSAFMLPAHFVWLVKYLWYPVSALTAAWQLY